jgi:endoglucanase
MAESLEDGSMSDVRGGWHDAGDYGRYVTAGACACAQLLYAYKFFPEVFGRLDLNIPETGSGIPDILSECRWELEWLLKMQRDDGSAYHKETTMRHAPFIMPEDDKSPMYLFTTSSSATADLCAVCALAAGIYKDVDESFSKRLGKAAERAYHWLEEHPEFVGFFNPTSCDTGLYAEEGDIDNRYWAAAEMFALTGDQKYNNHFQALFASPYFEGRSYIKTAFGHGMIGGLGSLAYVLCDRPGKSEEAVIFLKELITGEAYWLRDKANKCGYTSTLEEWEYYWGSNMTVLHSGMTFIIANLITGREEFYDYALEQLHVVLGRNALGVCYVTGMGEYSPVRPHYRPSAADKIDEPVPGFIIGGPNRELSDPFAKDLIPNGTPPMKCFVDDERCYSLNETTIYWNSPAVFLLAGIEDHESKKDSR